MQEKSGAYLKLLKRLHLDPASPEVELAAGAWSMALELARPAVFRERLDLPTFLECFEPHARRSSHLMSRLEGCTSVWVLAATIGPALEGRARTLFTSGQAFSGYVLDYFGTWLVDQTLREEIAGLRMQIGSTTTRLSPGVKDFPLAAQAVFVRLAGESLGLSLSSGSLLFPQKSITTVLGQGASFGAKQPNDSLRGHMP